MSREEEKEVRKTPEGKEIQEEEQRLGHVGDKVEHFRISRRDTLVNDLRNSTVEGITSFGAALTALLLLLVAIFLSYRAGGRSGYAAGILMVIDVLFTIAAVIFAGLGFKRKDKVRHYMEKRGLILGLIVAAALTALYVRGLILYLQNGL